MHANANNLASMMRRRLGTAPDPIFSLFANGEQGAWYDPSDSSTVFQDAAMTTPAGDGDPVGAIMDKSGNGNHATQSTAAARPILQQSGSLWYLDFDGVNHFVPAPTSTTGAAGTDNTAIFGLYSAGGGGNQYVFGGTSDKGLLMLTNGSNVNLRPGVQTSSGFVIDTGTGIFDEIGFVFSMEWDRSAGNIKGWGNQVLEVNTSGTAADKTSPVAFSLGGRGTDTPRYSGRMYSGIIIDRALSTAERNGAEDWTAEKCGVVL